jgi:hypothetical protein
LSNPGGVPVDITLQARGFDGLPLPNMIQTATLVEYGHSAKFARQFIPSVPTDFQGVIEISAPTPFAALTLRSLINARNEFLLTTLPVADILRPAPLPIVFPQVANGGGYITEFILLGVESEGTMYLDFLQNGGTSLPIGQ